MAPGDDVEDVVRREGQAELGLGGERMPVERGIDHRVARVSVSTRRGAVVPKARSTSSRPSNSRALRSAPPSTRNGGIRGAGPKFLIVARTASAVARAQLMPIAAELGLIAWTSKP